MQQEELRLHRRRCSRLGWSMVLTIVCALFWQTGLAVFAYVGRLNAGPAFGSLLMLVGYYIIALPLSFWLCRRVPRAELTPQRLLVRQMVRWFVIAIAVMWIGSLVGEAATDLVSSLVGSGTESLVQQAFDEMPLSVVVLGACVLGPVCEEVLFRGLIARRLAQYGQRPAAFVSAMLFGLYHANLEQFFYAFGLGLLLAYVYFRTGRLIAAIILHMLVNMFGSLVPILIGNNEAGLIVLGLSWLVLSVAGIVLLIRGRKRQVWEHGPYAPSMRVVFGNVGMTAAIVLCMVQTAVYFSAM